jgi:transcriptional regulator with XRE-family HTH domain
MMFLKSTRIKHGLSTKEMAHVLLLPENEYISLERASDDKLTIGTCKMLINGIGINPLEVISLLTDPLFDPALNSQKENKFSQSELQNLQGETSLQNRIL